MAKVVLDTSAVLAVLNFEPGADVVTEYLNDAAISVVNLAEVATKLLHGGQTLIDARRAISMLGLDVQAVDEAQAYAAAAFYPLTKEFGLSLGDRHCLALGSKLGMTVVTADKKWAKFKFGIEIKLIR